MKSLLNLLIVLIATRVTIGSAISPLFGDDCDVTVDGVNYKCDGGPGFPEKHYFEVPATPGFYTWVKASQVKCNLTINGIQQMCVVIHSATPSVVNKYLPPLPTNNGATFYLAALLYVVALCLGVYALTQVGKRVLEYTKGRISGANSPGINYGAEKGVMI